MKRRPTTTIEAAATTNIPGILKLEFVRSLLSNDLQRANELSKKVEPSITENCAALVFP